MRAIDPRSLVRVRRFANGWLLPRASAALDAGDRVARGRQARWAALTSAAAPSTSSELIVGDIDLTSRIPVATSCRARDPGASSGHIPALPARAWRSGARALSPARARRLLLEAEGGESRERPSTYDGVVVTIEVRARGAWRFISAVAHRVAEPDSRGSISRSIVRRASISRAPGDPLEVAGLPRRALVESVDA